MVCLKSKNACIFAGTGVERETYLFYRFLKVKTKYINASY